MHSLEPRISRSPRRDLLANRAARVGPATEFRFVAVESDDRCGAQE